MEFQDLESHSSPPPQDPSVFSDLQKQRNQSCLLAQEGEKEDVPLQQGKSRELKMTEVQLQGINLCDDNLEERINQVPLCKQRYDKVLIPQQLHIMQGEPSSEETLFSPRREAHNQFEKSQLLRAEADAEIADILKDLQLSKPGKIKLNVDIPPTPKPEAETPYKLLLKVACSVGKPKEFQLQIVQNSMKRAWRDNYWNIDQVDPYTFKAYFKSLEAMHYVVENQPWTMGGDTFLIEFLNPRFPDKPVEEYKFQYIYVTIRIYGIPQVLKTLDLIAKIINQVGQASDLHRIEGTKLYANRDYVLAKVKLDVSKPVKDTAGLEIAPNEELLAYINYEKLGRICTFCGLLFHTNVFCPKRRSLVMRMQSLGGDSSNIPFDVFGVWIRDASLIPKEAFDQTKNLFNSFDALISQNQAHTTQQAISFEGTSTANRFWREGQEEKSSNWIADKERYWAAKPTGLNVSNFNSQGGVRINQRDQYSFEEPTLTILPIPSSAVCPSQSIHKRQNPVQIAQSAPHLRKMARREEEAENYDGSQKDQMFSRQQSVPPSVRSDQNQAYQFQLGEQPESHNQPKDQSNKSNKSSASKVRGKYKTYKSTAGSGKRTQTRWDNKGPSSSQFQFGSNPGNTAVHDMFQSKGNFVQSAFQDHTQKHYQGWVENVTGSTFEPHSLDDQNSGFPTNAHNVMIPASNIQHSSAGKGSTDADDNQETMEGVVQGMQQHNQEAVAPALKAPWAP